jgi:shikimate 5-dehydrogenase
VVLCCPRCVDRVVCRKFGLIGRGVSHSLSPAIHNAAFGYYSLPYTYVLIDCDTVWDVDRMLAVGERVALRTHIRP